MWFPRITSLLQVALLALAAVLVPPAIALGTALLAVEDLARSGSQTVVEAARTVDLARSVVEHVTALERVAKQRRALGDADLALRDRYEARRIELLEDLTELRSLPHPPEVAEQLAALQATEAAQHEVLAAEAPESAAYGRALEDFPDLAGRARAALGGSGDAIGEAANAMRRDAVALERRLLRQVAWVVPSIAIVLVLAGVGIVRPLRSLDAAIRRLGAGELERPIAIRGPADLRDLGTRLEWLRQHLEAVESDRMQLLRHVSHELKTPLTCIREGNQLLQDGVTGELSPAQRELTSIIGANATELGRRIDELLRASDLSKGQTTIDRLPVRLDEVVQRVLDQNSVAARARAVRFAAELAPVETLGDAAKLRTVVDNLVTNAVKFSPEGGTVRLTLIDGRGGAVLAVEDEGPGLDPAERERVFEPFQQGRATWMSAVGGSGLGLAIARQYVRAHGGELAVEDAPVGARMVVRFAQPARAAAGGAS